MVVADDHPPVVDSLSRRIPEYCDARVVAQCYDGRAALAAIFDRRPGIALLDLRMPELGGRGILAEVVRAKLATRVVIYSAHEEPRVVRALLEEGAAGYLGKGTPWPDVFTAVRTVAAGGSWVSRNLQSGLYGELGAPLRMPSPRELEVLRHASRGLTDAQIGAVMYISPETVRTNLKRCSEKLGVSGRTALVAEALRQGLIE